MLFFLCLLRCTDLKYCITLHMLLLGMVLAAVNNRIKKNQKHFQMKYQMKNTLQK